jgi:hypothetical protein
MASSFLIGLGLFIAGKLGVQIPSHIALLIVVAATSAIWITVTLLTEPTDRETLVRFYRLVRPAGRGWLPVQAEAGVGGSPDSLPQMFLGWTLGITFVYAGLFGTGSFIYGNLVGGTIWLVLFLVSGVGLIRLIPRLWSGTPAA